MSAVAEREVLRIVRRGLVSYTERTITELEPLLEELARIRRRGYATALGEFEMGLNAVAAPVHDARGNVIAAVDIWGPAFRLTPRRIPELAAQAREAAAAISVRLGGTGTATAAQPTLAQALSNSSIAATRAGAAAAGRRSASCRPRSPPLPEAGRRPPVRGRACVVDRDDRRRARGRRRWSGRRSNRRSLRSGVRWATRRPRTPASRRARSGPAWPGSHCA